MKITVLAIGKYRGVEAQWADEYLKRLGASVRLHELAVSKSLPASEAQKTEARLLLHAIPPKSFVILLDEHGKDMSSRAFATKLAQWQEHSCDLTFIIGGADGFHESVRAKADFIWGFGSLTWPHRLVRVMVLEQLYRAKQINAGHPYHRD